MQGADDRAIPAERFSVFSRRSELEGCANAVIELTDGGHVDSLYKDGLMNPKLKELIFGFIAAEEELAA